MKSLIVYAYISLILFTSHLCWSKIIYVNLAATGENTGMSWTDAYIDLQIALASAEGNDEIWVAEGRYTPASSGGGRDSTFQLPPGVSLYGGFFGTEETLVERLWNKHKTTLSGDLMGNDNEGEEENRVENSYHVITITGTGNNALLDGFIIRDGNADADNDVRSPHPQKGNGGGIHIDGTGRGESLGPSILNCEFRNNSTIFPESSDIPGIGLGGGIHIIDSNVRIENCYFTQNSSFRGGGLSVDSSSTVRLINSLFYNNSATIEGGAIYNKSGITFCTNCTIVRNKAKKDAAIYFGPESTTITNSIVWGNRLTPTEDEPNAHFFVNSTFDVSSNRKAILSYSIVQIRENIEPEEGSAVVNPQFIDVNDPDGSDDLFFTEDDGLQLSRDSVGIDAGRSDTLDFSPIDILGNGRVDDMGIVNSGLGTPDFVDLGAYERQTNSFHLLTVTHDGNGTVSPTELVEFVPGTLEPRISAIPNSGYEFDFWSSDRDEATIRDENEPVTTIAITADTTVTARFQIAPLEFVVVAEEEPFLVPTEGNRGLIVRLSGPPAAPIVARASIEGSDQQNIFIENGDELTFTPEDWGEPHVITLSALDEIGSDTDTANLFISQSSGLNPVTNKNFILKVNKNLKKNTAVTFIEPKEDEEITFGRTIPVQALITSENGDAIFGNNGVIVRFLKSPEETVIAELDELSEDGFVVLNDNFVPDSAGTWVTELEWLGSAIFEPKTSTHNFVVQPAETTITLLFQGATHVLGQELTIVGQLKISSLNPGNVDLSGVEMNVRLIDPLETLRPLPVIHTSNDEDGINGQFAMTIPGTVFDMEGNWELQVATDGNANLMPSKSETITIRVLRKPGYAILCLGSVPAPPGGTPEGIDDHRRTIDYVKTVLSSDAGFTDDTQNPNSLTDDIYEIGQGDPKTKLEQAIKDWARQKMTDAPAPLYLMMINHGESDKFHMNIDSADELDNVLSSSELKGWLDDLQEAFLDPETGNILAAAEKIVVVLGMCFSGSFINELSKEGRVIVSASAGNERSIRGPSDVDPSDPIARHGEYFVYLLFRELSNGASLFNSFRSSRDTIRQVSARFDLATNSVAPEFPGELGQHPLLDDNGDGKGSFDLSVESEDGEIAKNLFLVTPTNSIGALDIARTHPSLFLAPNDDVQGLLWAEVDERPRNVNSMFMEVKKPGALDPDPGDQIVSDSMQAGLDLTKQLMIPDDNLLAIDRVRYTWPGLEPDLELFEVPGAYQLFYYVKAASVFQPSEPKAGFVYRGTGTSAPSPFRLLSPENGATIDFDPENDDLDRAFGVFRWEQSRSNAGDVRYIFRLWKDESRSDLVLETDLSIPSFISFNSDELPMGTFFWDVMAVDEENNAKPSQDMFKIDIIVPGGPPAIVGGLGGTLFDRATGDRITAPGTIFISSEGETIQTSNHLGFFIKLVQSGTYTVQVEITGYVPETQTGITIEPGPPVTVLFELEKAEEAVSQRQLNVTTNPPTISAFIEGTQSDFTDFETILSDNFRVQLKAPLTIVVGDTGYQFMQWRKSRNGVQDDEIVTLPELPSFTIDADTTLVAEYQEIGFDLKSGWNLVSTPVDVQPTSKISNRFFSENGDLPEGEPIWIWQDGHFRAASSFEPGIGYWINESQPQKIPTRGSMETALPQILKKGWNLVGVKGFMSVTSSLDADIIQPIWAWDNKNQRYFPIDSELAPAIHRGQLVPGNAYWIYAKRFTAVSLGGP